MQNKIKEGDYIFLANQQALEHLSIHSYNLLEKKNIPESPAIKNGSAYVHEQQNQTWTEVLVSQNSQTLTKLQISDINASSTLVKGISQCKLTSFKFDVMLFDLINNCNFANLLDLDLGTTVIEEPPNGFEHMQVNCKLQKLALMNFEPWMTKLSLFQTIKHLDISHSEVDDDILGIIFA